MGLLTYAIPGFLVLIAIEAAISEHHHLEYYRLNDSINDLSLGIINQVVSALTAASLTLPYVWLYNTGHLLPLSEFSPLAWAVGFLGVDFAYYWFHRSAHERNLLWAAHVVHHQSEEYNLTVALRQSAFEPWFTWIFRLPLALLGVPPLTMLACVAINGVYQFWIHTRTIRSLGPLEEIFNTPSHHRVHHGRNPKYLDKNYGGMFIFWDKWFGTFQAEEEPAVYGITHALNSWNPLWANVQHVVQTVHRSAEDAVLDRLRVWWQPPGWRPDGAVDAGDPLDRPKYDAQPDDPGWWVVPVLQLAVTVALTILLLVLAPALSGLTVAALGGWIVLSLVNISAVMERRHWAKPAQVALFALAVVMVLVLVGGVTV